MKRTSISTSIVCALLLGTNVQAETLQPEYNQYLQAVSCTIAEQPYSCIDEQFCRLEHEFKLFRESELTLEQQLNQLLEDVYVIPDNEHKAQLFEAMENVFQTVDAQYQGSEEIEPHKTEIYQEAAELEERLAGLYQTLAQTLAETLVQTENEGQVTELKAMIDDLELRQLELHQKGVELAFQQLAKLVPILNIKDNFIGVVQEYLRGSVVANCCLYL